MESHLVKHLIRLFVLGRNSMFVAKHPRLAPVLRRQQRCCFDLVMCSHACASSSPTVKHGHRTVSHFESFCWTRSRQLWLPKRFPIVLLELASAKETQVGGAVFPASLCFACPSTPRSGVTWKNWCWCWGDRGPVCPVAWPGGLPCTVCSSTLCHLSCVCCVLTPRWRTCCSTT